MSTFWGGRCLGGRDVDPQADRRGRVCVPDPAGCCPGCDRYAAHRTGRLLLPARRGSGPVGRVGAGRRRHDRRPGGDRRPDGGPVRGGPAPDGRPDHRRPDPGEGLPEGRGRRDRAGQTVPPAGGHPRLPGRGRPARRRGQRRQRCLPGHGPGGRGAGPDPHRGGPGDVRRGLRQEPEGPPGAVLVHRPQLPVDGQRDRRVRPDVHPGQVGVGAVGDRPPARRRRRSPPPTTPPSPTSWAGWSGKPAYTRGGPQRRAAARHHRPARRGVRPPRLPSRRPGPAHPRRGLLQGPRPGRGRHPGPVAGPGRPGPVQGHRHRVASGTTPASRPSCTDGSG